MLLSMRDIRKEQREELHIIFLVRSIVEVGSKQNNAALKTFLVPIVYNGQMPHQNINQLLDIFCEMFIFHIIFCPIAMAFVSNPSVSEDSQSSSGTDLNIVNTEDKMHIDTTNWTLNKRKKLQHMAEFHEDYQWIFGEKASIHTIMKKRISHMNPPMPDSVCKEEMQNATVDTNDVIIEYITDAQGRKIKKLKPLLIKMEPDREYIQHVNSGDNLPNVPEDNFLQKREVTIDSYSETISSDSSSDDSTITADNDDSTSSMEDKSCVWEADSTGIEASLHQIASGLQNAAEGYLTLASHVSKIAPYELPQVIAQIPPTPIDVPMPIRNVLSVGGESKVVNYLLHGEYEMTNTSWSKLQKKYNLSKNKIYSALKGKRRPGGSQYQQKKKQTAKLKSAMPHTYTGTE